MIYIISILKLQCPNCQKGKIFSSNNILDLPKIAEMPDRCPVCDFDIQQEDGFYYGAMFISYVFLAFFILTIVGLFILINGGVSTIQLLIILGLVMLFWPYWFRLARAMWLTIYYKTRLKK